MAGIPIDSKNRVFLPADIRRSLGFGFGNIIAVELGDGI